MCNRKGESGISMIEIIVALAIFSIISVVVMTFFFRSTTDFYKIQATNFETADRLQVIDRIAKVLRGGAGIQDARPNTLTFFAYFSPNDTKPSKITYNYDINQKSLVVTWIMASGSAPDYVYSNADAKTSTLLKDAVLTTDLFRYYDKDGNTGPFDSANYSNISKVEVYIHKKPTQGGNIQSADLSTTVVLRNVRGLF